MAKTKKCDHGHIDWRYSQMNPDVGVCMECGRLVYAETLISAIHSEDELGYREKILKVLRRV